MIAYSRGSQCLAGAASLRNRMPAMIRAFTHLTEIAQWIEQQPISCRCGFNSCSLGTLASQR